MGPEDAYELARRGARVVYSVGDRADHIGQIKAALIRLGYMAEDGDGQPPDEFSRELERSVRLYQRYFHLPATGRLDVATLKLLRMPRCGVKDIPEEALADALSDAGDEAADPFTFRFNSQPWPRYDLTYEVYNGTADTTGEVGIIDQAFQVWQAVSPLRFTRAAAPTHIRIGWEVGDHGDGSPFDGVGTIVAHGFYPENGRMHFDDAETWSTTSGHVDLFNVAIHEIGHVLGLGHSRERGAIMWPFVQDGVHTLGEEDIRGILSLYPWIVGSSDVATVVHLWAFAGGSSSALIDLGARRRFLAWGQPTFYDSLARFDRDNGVAFDIFTVDGNNPLRVGFGGDHLATNGAPSNLFAGAVLGVGRRVQFRLSTFHSSDLEAYGVGCLLVLDR
jgi:peptidoglycan hydrolase-like protein with peptidoglycan-binding domain